MAFSNFEKQVFKKGYQRVAGIDEAGRGSLAGPVVAAIVMTNEKTLSLLPIKKIKDSKQLSAKQREEIFEMITQEPKIEWQVSAVWPKVIDRINIWQATLLTWQRCLKKLNHQPDFLFLDGKIGIPHLSIKQKPIIKGDEKVLLLSLASIIAKVSRDKIMKDLDKRYPRYGFAQHKGYGTRFHSEKLKKNGSCRIHRQSFNYNLCYNANMILIKNITLVTQNPKRRIIEKGALLIENDIIKDIGQSKAIEKKYRQQVKKVIDGQGKVALPGLINTHGHLAMTLLRGYADDLSLEDWWQNYIYPIESKFGRKEVYWGSLLAMLEMIKSGTTCFTDFYYYEDEVAKAAQEIGMRGVLGCAALDFPTFYFKTPSEALEKARKLVQINQEPLTSFALAPHMLQTTSLKTYQKAKKLADEYDLLLTTHTAETKQEVDYCLKKYKQRPVEVLNKEGILDNKTLLAHCCWLTKKEIKILAKSGASVSHCPVSNMKLAVGIMPLLEMTKVGVNVSLGTDSACSNNNLDMFEEMKAAALLHKVNQLDPTVADAQTILDMATINGARALGLEKEIGSLESGKKADLIILDFEQSHLIPHHNIISHLVYAAKGSDVETVMINGQIVMAKKKIKKVNQDKVSAQIKKVALFRKK